MLRTLRLNIARLSAATYTGYIEYLKMPLWLLVQIMEDAQQAHRKG